MTTISQLQLHLRQGTWLIYFELADTYWHMPVYKHLRKFLAFQVGKEVYQFWVMPFGLLLAPRFFTKLTKVVAAKLTEKVD